MTLTAAADFARSFAVLLDADSTPVYGHLVVARSVFDACVVAAWLNDPKADATERVKRGLCEQLYSAMELVRLGLEDDAAERRDYWKARAAALGWTANVSSNKPVIDGTSRPSVSTALSELLVGNGKARIGRAQWSYLSSRLARHLVWPAAGHHERRAVAGSEPRPRLVWNNIVVRASAGGVGAPGTSQGRRRAVRPHGVGRRGLARRDRMNLTDPLAQRHGLDAMSCITRTEQHRAHTNWKPAWVTLALIARSCRLTRPTTEVSDEYLDL